ncbi:Piezo-type mechanosensitive ion channel component 2, partial [Varanus komodoensis]
MATEVVCGLIFRLLLPICLVTVMIQDACGLTSIDCDTMVVLRSSIGSLTLSDEQESGIHDEKAIGGCTGTCLEQWSRSRGIQEPSVAPELRVANPWSRPWVLKLRPAGRFRPTMAIHPARRWWLARSLTPPLPPAPRMSALTAVSQGGLAKQVSQQQYVFYANLVWIDKPLCFFAEIKAIGLTGTCAFRYNGLSFVYLIYLLLIPLFSEPTKTTMQDQEMALAGVMDVAVRCRSCDVFALLPQERQAYTCPRCKLVVLLQEELRGHQLLLVIHVGTINVAGQVVGRITRDFEALGKKLRELKAQVAFSSILPVRGFGPGRDRRVSEVNDWPRVWCQNERFGFLNHGTQFLANGLLARDGLHLTRMAKRSFGDALLCFEFGNEKERGSDQLMTSTAQENIKVHLMYLNKVLIDRKTEVSDFLRNLQLFLALFNMVGHTGRLLKSLCFMSLTFLLLHIIFQITINSLEAANTIEPGYH